MKNVRGKAVLVTGGAKGIGRSVAERFAREGARVVIWDVDAEALDETARRLRELDLDILTEVVDVTDWDAVREAADRAQADVGPVEVLFNNAGIFMAGSFTDIDFESHARLIEINVIGQMAVLKAILPGMIARDSGHVITMASAGSFTPAPRQASYCASKAANLHLADTLRAELRSEGKKGIRFTSMCPSYVDTTMVTGIKPPMLTRWIEPDDFAEIVFQAYLEDKTTVRVPFMAKTVPLLRALMPERVVYAISKLLGVNSAAATWKK